MRVLVVEDHVELAETVARVLRREGMAVDLAFDGRTALVNAAVYGYEVIVLDRDLPGAARGRGVQAAGRARQQRAGVDADRLDHGRRPG